MDEMEPAKRYLTHIQNHFERHIRELDSRHDKLMRNYQNALKRNDQDKAKKYDERLDKAEEELREFNEYVERLHVLIGYVSKPLDEQTFSEQLDVLEYLKRLV